LSPSRAVWWLFRFILYMAIVFALCVGFLTYAALSAENVTHFHLWDEQELMPIAFDLNGLCRGSIPNVTMSEKSLEYICELRDAMFEELIVRGRCYNPQAASRSQLWYAC